MLAGRLTGGKESSASVKFLPRDGSIWFCDFNHVLVGCKVNPPTFRSSEGSNASEPGGTLTGDLNAYIVQIAKVC